MWRSWLCRVVQVWAYFPPTCIAVGSEALRQRSHVSDVRHRLRRESVSMALCSELHTFGLQFPPQLWLKANVFNLGALVWVLSNMRIKKGTFTFYEGKITARSCCCLRQIKSPLLQTLRTLISLRLCDIQVKDTKLYHLHCVRQQQHTCREVCSTVLKSSMTGLFDIAEGCFICCLF